MRCDQQRAARHWLVSKATRGNGREQPIAVSQRASNESRPGRSSLSLVMCHVLWTGRHQPKPSGSSILLFQREKKKNHWDHRLYLSQPLIVRKVLTAGIINNYASDADIILTELQRHINSTQNWQQGPSLHGIRTSIPWAIFHVFFLKVTCFMFGWLLSRSREHNRPTDCCIFRWD